MNQKRTMMALAVIMMAVVPMSILMSDGSDAGVYLEDGKVWGEGFTNTSDGTLSVSLRSTEYEGRLITITVTENGRELAKAEVTVPAGDPSYVAKLSFRLDSVGDHDVTVTCEPDNLFPLVDGSNLNSQTTTIFNSQTITITVTESIWSKPATYGAIAVIAILVVIAFYLRMRSAPATKPDVTFTELEQRKGSKEDAEEKPKAPVTERKRYKGSEAKPKEAKPKGVKAYEPPEKKEAETFTELEQQKKEEKKEAPPKKKEASSGEPKKLKYVSSRRK